MPRYWSTVSSRFMDVVPVAYMDDLVLPLQFDEATHSLNGIASAASIVKSVFLCFKLDVSFKPGKTEATIFVRGKGSQSTLQSLSKSGYKVPIPSIGGGPLCEEPLFLSIVDCYRHVGTKCTAGSNMSAEVSYRSALVSASVFQFSRIFSNCLVSDADKLLVARM